jgi:hypothetical protein
MKWRRALRATASVLSILVFLITSQTYAAQSSSTNYSVDQVFFGSGSQLNACSTNYCSRQSAGDTAVGNAAGTAFQAIAGSNTDRNPYIAFSTSGGATDLGILSTAGTATATATFAVKTYLASGYAVTLASPPPTATGTGGHVFSALTSPTAAAAPGTAEQFGINLVANTTGCGAPANFGANPVQVPSSSFSYGTIASGYNTCGLFKYVNGDTVANSTKSSGETDYTVSFIYNITSVTQDGYYVFNGSLVATSTY